jgi:hypothetical protein
MTYKKPLIIALIIVIMLPIIAYSTLRFGLSKDNISYPAKDHSHFRIKYIFQGQEEDFGSPRYQTDYTKDICNGTLTTSPLHFHDNKTDYQHTHWTRGTGGQFLKFYGLNLIGGLDNYLGFKLDELPKITPVPIHSNSLPKPRTTDKFFVYTGEEVDGKWQIRSRNWQDFVNQDFETFLGKESQVRKDEEKYGTKRSSFQLPLTITTQAHNGEEHATLDEATKHEMLTKERALANTKNNQVISVVSSIANSNTSSNITVSQANSLNSTNSISSTNSQNSSSEVSTEELKSINNFLGDIVIFVQDKEPTQEQVEARFKTMVKLEKSVCGG